MKRTFRLTCEFCKTVSEVQLEHEGLRVRLLDWIGEHRACSRGQPIKVNCTAQRDAAAPEEPILSAVVPGR